MKPNKELTRVAECLWRHSNGKYYGIVRVAGRQIKKSLKTKDRLTAKQELVTFRRQAERTAGSEGRMMRFSELADGWLVSRKGHMQPSTYDTMKAVVASLKTHFGTQVARDITPRQTADWASQRQVEKTRLGQVLSPRRYNYELQTLRLIFHYGISPLRILMDSPCSHLKRRTLPRFERATPTLQQFRDLIAELRAEPNSKFHGGGADLVEFLGYSGSRSGAVKYLRWQHVDWVSGMITLRDEKYRGGGRDYTVPLNPSLRELLSRLQSQMPGAAPTSRVIKINDAKKAIMGACRRAKLPTFTPHSMRHFFASSAVEAGVDFKVVAEWLGHTDGGWLVSKTYSHLRADYSRQQAERMTFSVISQETK